MTDQRQRVETTFADLRSDDLIVDKSGKEWEVSIRTSPEGGLVLLVLGGLHHMTKVPTDPVTVSRVTPPPRWAEDQHLPDLPESWEEKPVAKLGQEVPMSTERAEALADDVKIIEEELGGEVVAVESKAEEVARKSGDVVPLPLFADMTDLEQKSHLFLLHGTYVEDVESRAKRVELHDRLHADPERRDVAHSHDAGNEFPS